MHKLKVTLGVIAYNEEKYLPQLLECILKQTYPQKLMEIVLVDGHSEDNTYYLMKKFEDKYKNVFDNIVVCENKKRTQPSGWNVVIEHMAGDVLIRIDAHAIISDNFVECNVRCLESGESVCGGPRTNIIDEDTPWKRTLLTAEQSMFGSGIAPYRRKSNEKKYVKSVFHAAYRREVIEKVGLFNENLLRTEDNEYHYRVRKAGYKICYDENIQSYYQTRNSLKRMIKQKYGNGFWIGRTSYTVPQCLSLYHFIPSVFVGCLFIAVLIKLLFSVDWFWKLIVYPYEVICAVLTILCWIKDKFLMTDLGLIWIFPILHISYGVGIVRGLLKGKV